MRRHLADSGECYSIQMTGGRRTGAAWKKASQAGHDHLSVMLDDPSLPATIYACLIEDEEGGKHSLIWSRSKPTA